LPSKYKILWVEDSARFELAFVLGPIFASNKYDLTLAENASDAADKLAHRRFDAIIVDIRLPPGNHRYWLSIYRNAGSDRTNAKLGLALLSWLLQADPVAVEAKASRRSRRPINDNLPVRPQWPVRPTQVGVFSVENHGEIGAHLDGLGVSLMYEKRPGLADTVLLDIVSQILQIQVGKSE